MRKIITYLLLLCLYALVPGCKKTAANTDFCHNGVLDTNQGETEIDCGGPCTACPPAATLSAKLNGTWYSATKVYWTQSGPSCSIRASNPTKAISLGLFFKYPTINQTELLTSASIDDNNNYIIEPGDTSSFTITSVDTLRKIISGTFILTATAPPNNPLKLDSGTFTNVRINLQQ